MNLKRVLVLVMALVMVVSACAPSVLAATETTHNHNDTSEGLGLVDKYRDIKDIVAHVVDDVVENHDEYYADAYAYLVDNGYVAEATLVIDVALDKLEEIDLEALGATAETKDNLATELGAVVSALEGLKAVLNDGTAGNLDAFVTSILANVGEIYVHINNVNAINDQLMVDYDRDDVLAYVENVVIPELEALVEEYDEEVIAYAKENIDPYAAEVVKAYNVSLEAYETLVEIVMTVELYVDGTVDALVFVHDAMVDALFALYEVAYPALKNEIESFDYSVENLQAILNGAIDAAIELDKYVEIGLDHLDRFIVWAADAYVYTVEIVEHAYGDLANAVVVATKIYDYVLDVEYVLNLLKQGGELLAADVYANVVEILNDSYEQDGDIYFIAARLSAYVTGRIDDLEAMLGDLHNGAVNGNYELKDDSYYVALGNSAYAEALAGKLNLAEKYEVVSLSESYINNIAKADLVTVKLDNGEFVALAEKQVLGKIAEIIRSHTELMTWYNSVDTIVANEAVPEDIRNAFSVAKDVFDGMIDINATSVELDWNKYLDAEGQTALNNLLAELKSDLIAAGLPENYYFDINPYIDEALAANGMGDIFTFTFAPVVIPVADLAVFAVENSIYGYAGMVDDVTTVINNTNATVVLTKINNSLVGYSYQGIDFSEYAEYVDSVVDALNANLYAFALVNENVVFVNSEDANDIYDALNVYCDHVYDDCLDVDCNRCLAVRVAPGHSFTNYVFEESTSCKVDGTETAKCDHCDATNTRTVQNTKGPHDWKDATCTSPKKCAACGATEGDVTGHTLGEWRLVKDPTTRSEGVEERKCLNCDYTEQRAIPNTSLSTMATIAIIVACVAVAGVASAGVARVAKNRKTRK